MRTSTQGAQHAIIRGASCDKTYSGLNETQYYIQSQSASAQNFQKQIIDILNLS